jgi:FkbM family methyltransferase
MNPDIIDLQYAIERLPMWGSRVAVDVGAHNGDITRFFLDKGFDVLAMEPNQQKRKALDAIGGRSLVYSLAASDKSEQRDMLLFTDDGLNSLEQAWANDVFPHAYRAQSVQVGCRTLASVFDEVGITEVAILKIDVEGHEMQALRGLFQGSVRPDIIVFEVNEKLPDRAEECVRILCEKGYGNFSSFLKHGSELLSFSRNLETTSLLPSGWKGCTGLEFYGNMIARRLP